MSRTAAAAAAVAASAAARPLFTVFDPASDEKEYDQDHHKQKHDRSKIFRDPGPHYFLLTEVRYP